MQIFSIISFDDVLLRVLVAQSLMSLFPCCCRRNVCSVALAASTEFTLASPSSLSFVCWRLSSGSSTCCGRRRGRRGAIPRRTMMSFTQETIFRGSPWLDKKNIPKALVAFMCGSNRMERFFNVSADQWGCDTWNVCIHD